MIIPIYNWVVSYHPRHIPSVFRELVVFFPNKCSPPFHPDSFVGTGNLGHLHLRHGWQPFRVVNEISGSDGWWKTEERSVCCIKKTKTRHPKNNWTCNLFHISSVWKGNSQKQHLSWLLPIGLAYGVSDFIHVYTFSGLKEIQRTSRISDTEDAQRHVCFFKVKTNGFLTNRHPFKR